MREANLSKANMYYADLENACLIGANLCEANLDGASLDKAVFEARVGQLGAEVTPEKAPVTDAKTPDSHALHIEHARVALKNAIKELRLFQDLMEVGIVSSDMEWAKNRLGEQLIESATQK